MLPSLVIASALLFAAMVPLVRSKDPLTDAFPIILFASGVYYAVLGPAYWLWVEDGYFSGVNWSAQLPGASLIFALAICLYLVSYRLVVAHKTNGLRRARRVVTPVPQKAKVILAPRRPPKYIPRAVFICLGLGLGSALFVFAKARSNNAFFLIAYQLSDLAIPCIAFGLAARPKSRTMWLSALAFIAYSVFAGFRYKLVLLMLPIWLVLLSTTQGVSKRVVQFVVPVLVLAGFALITITRTKFSGLDLTGVSRVSSQSFLYGFFSETNVLFGVTSILDTVLPKSNYIYFTPFVDSLLELIPKVLIGSRNTGEQIYMVLEGLYTDEGFNSATTYPFFGEYLMMFGYLGFVLGVASAGSAAALLVAKVIKWSPSRSIASAGVGLIAATFGYYYVSRGYLPQFTKALVFVVLPYLAFLWQVRRRKWRLN